MRNTLIITETVRAAAYEPTLIIRYHVVRTCIDLQRVIPENLATVEESFLLPQLLVVWHSRYGVQNAHSRQRWKFLKYDTLNWEASQRTPSSQKDTGLSLRGKTSHDVQIVKIGPPERRVCDVCA